jgi:hypothetical protein
MREGIASWEMRNDHRMAGSMSEHNRPFDPSNDPPAFPDNPDQPEPVDAQIPGLDVHDDLARPLRRQQPPPRG